MTTLHLLLLALLAYAYTLGGIGFLVLCVWAIRRRDRQNAELRQLAESRTARELLRSAADPEVEATVRQIDAIRRLPTIEPKRRLA